MSKFEEYLITLGYLKFRLNCKTMKFEKAEDHVISTMINLDHRYVHYTDINLLSKINQGISVMDENFTHEDRTREICFGLHEAGKPATLIAPRPRIKVKRIDENGDKITYSQFWDDSMNICLANIDFPKIFEAMYDNSKIFEFDLT